MHEVEKPLASDCLATHRRGINAGLTFLALIATGVLAHRYQIEVGGEWWPQYWFMTKHLLIQISISIMWLGVVVWFAHSMSHRRLWVLGVTVVFAAWFLFQEHARPEPADSSSSLVLDPFGLMILIIATLLVTFVYEAVKQNLDLVKTLIHEKSNKTPEVLRATVTVWWPTLIVLAIGVLVSCLLDQQIEAQIYSATPITKTCTVEGADGAFIECEEVETTVITRDIIEKAESASFSWRIFVRDRINDQRHAWLNFLATVDNRTFGSTEEFRGAVAATPLMLSPEDIVPTIVQSGQTQVVDLRRKLTRDLH